MALANLYALRNTAGCGERMIHIKQVLESNSLLAIRGVNGVILASAPVSVWWGSCGHIELECSFRFMDLFGWNQKTLRRNAIFIMALLSLALLMHEVFGRNGYLTLRHEKKEYIRLQQQIQTVSDQNQLLEQNIHALKNNPEAVEKQARDQLHLARPGEIIYMLPGKPTAQTQASSQQIPQAQPHPTR